MNVASGMTFVNVWHCIPYVQSISVCYSPSPATIGITVPLDEKDRTVNEEQAKNSVTVDSSCPVTTVQIRLADGSRLVGQFNHSHTVADIRRFIVLYPLQVSCH
jgi:UBX domain-containing protein 1